MLIAIYCCIEDEKEYISSDSIDKSEANDFDVFLHLIPEFFSCLKTFFWPNLSIKLKIGTTIMLLRNLGQSEVLCNGKDCLDYNSRGQYEGEFYILGTFNE